MEDNSSHDGEVLKTTRIEGRRCTRHKDKKVDSQRGRRRTFLRPRTSTYRQSESPRLRDNDCSL
ncbi:hypothetical protein V6Z12_A05G259800 [Gossypium hirsutum]